MDSQPPFGRKSTCNEINFSGSCPRVRITVKLELICRGCKSASICHFSNQILSCHADTGTQILFTASRYLFVLALTILFSGPWSQTLELSSTFPTKTSSNGEEKKKKRSQSARSFRLLYWRTDSVLFQLISTLNTQRVFLPFETLAGVLV